MRRTILCAALALSVLVPANAQVYGKATNIPAQGSYTPSFKVDGAKKRPLNIILMIGDGTGLAQISAGFYANGGELTLTNLRTLGLVSTQSADDYTTDSAASGTAYACGQKTNNWVVGVDTEGKPIPNLPEKLAPLGIVSGIVTTDEMDGATPASFFAHQANRGMSAEIWGDLPSSSIIFFAAGSKENFERQSEATREAVRNRFVVTDSLDPALRDAPRLGYLPLASETQSMKYGRGDFLPASTIYAIDFLMRHKTARRKGFFLMVEGARIDKSCHANEFEPAVKEMLDFDKAIEAAIRFAEKDGNTLVLVTADHETGGLSLCHEGNPAEGTVAGWFATSGHTPIPVPIYAYGPHSQDFIGMQGNEEVSRKIFALLSGK